MGARDYPEERPKFVSISIYEETRAALDEMKGPGKTWDRFIREKLGLPLVEGVPA